MAAKQKAEVVRRCIGAARVGGLGSQYHDVYDGVCPGPRLMVLNPCPFHMLDSPRGAGHVDPEGRASNGFNGLAEWMYHRVEAKPFDRVSVFAKRGFHRLDVVEFNDVDRDFLRANSDSSAMT